MSGLAAAVIEAISAAGPGPADLLSGLFQAQGRPDWPRGVQESDAPGFALDHVESLRPASDARPRAPVLVTGIEAQPDGEIIELSREAGTRSERLAWH